MHSTLLYKTCAIQQLESLVMLLFSGKVSVGSESFHDFEQIGIRIRHQKLGIKRRTPSYQDRYFIGGVAAKP